MPPPLYNIGLLAPPGYPHYLAFREVAILLSASFQSLNIPATFHVNTLDPNATNIILGYHLIKNPATLAGIRYIPYQLEQLTPESPFFTQRLIDVLKDAAEVWEYSPRNLPMLQQLGIQNVQLLPLAYHEKLELIPPSAPPAAQDIDILHYGMPNDRRNKILNELRKHCHVVHLEGGYGEHRDDFIARAKLILSIHYYESKITPQVRISYLLNNRRPVVAESGADDPFPNMTACVPYDQLVDTCLKLLADPSARQSLATRGYELFKQTRMRDNLRKILK